MGKPSVAVSWWIGSTFALVLAVPAAWGQPSAPTPGARDTEKRFYQTRYRVIDVHVHGGEPRAEAVAAQIDVMDRAGIAAAVNLDGGRTGGTLPAWIKLQNKYPGRIAVFAKFTKKDFARVREPGFFGGLVRELERAAKMGARGVKVWKDLGMLIEEAPGRRLRIDDPRLDPFWAKCGELGLPVLIHTADPKEYWYPLTYNSLHYGARSEEDQLYRIPGMPRWEDLIAQRDRVLKKHPKTTFIGAHFGSMTFDLHGRGANGQDDRPPGDPHGSTGSPGQATCRAASFTVRP